MNQFTGDSKYIDVLERSLYNGALAGISLKGDRFFYVNPLESRGDHHRQEWYGCACCPSQISRFLPSIGNYIYGTSADAIWVNLYIGNEASFKVDGEEIRLRQSTDYPWNGEIALQVSAVRPLKKDFRLRIPGWCKEYSVLVNDEPVEPKTDKGYVVLNNTWEDGDIIRLDLSMPVEVEAADPRVKEDIGKRAIQRGPLVYCLEEVDNPDNFDNLSISPSTSFLSDFESSLLDGVVVINARNADNTLSFIPYYAWDNREAGKMKVWIEYKE